MAYVPATATAASLVAIPAGRAPETGDDSAIPVAQTAVTNADEGPPQVALDRGRCRCPCSNDRGCDGVWHS